ncbi:hypothetical protein BCF11_0148 [Collimonas sp. PA-H2]|uniref:hypothetical protein n=1 Tax=Collimonas sp. PA-H2 TaxID=1881062 RepID=UPI000BF77185|nr:hypothetical protein [Collimonas sp. PA-H2]PFH07808.1 hypothetical protein BCF11_0148 [Collimonas sp. PA-H2]
MNIETIIHRKADFQRQEENVILGKESHVGGTLDEVLKESFPAGDPYRHCFRETAMSTESIEFSLAWWFKLYVFGVTTMCLLTNREPKQEKSLYWCKKALRASYNGKRIEIS